MAGQWEALPPQWEVSQTFRKAPKAKGKPTHQQPGLFEQAEGAEG
jgi:hypothetical protein